MAITCASHCFVNPALAVSASGGLEVKAVPPDERGDAYVVLSLGTDAQSDAAAFTNCEENLIAP